MIRLFGFLFGYTFLCLLSLNGHAQAKYAVFFKDKPHADTYLDSPKKMLSERALQRRSKNKIAIDITDVPVYKPYTDSIQRLGLPILYTSRWMNAALVYSTDSSSFTEKIKKLAFVSGFSLLKPGLDRKLEEEAKERKVKKLDMLRLEANTYGLSADQNTMLCADQMHKMLYTGERVLIAVLDGGFRNANTVYFLDTLFQRGGILDTWDFVSMDRNVYDDSNHGTQVLSVMAAYVPGTMIGTGYGADYLLYRSEDEATEYPIEELNWCVAAERADSVGADIINSSLGYSTFDDSYFNHIYADMNGKATLVSRAANMAFNKGILIVTSAGNSGAGAWRYITAPADAEGVLAVAALDREGQVTSFSSRGPSADGRVKPDLAALGAAVTVGDGNRNVISASNGTSFASPLIAGLISGLIQAYPTYTYTDIRRLVLQSATHYYTPNNDIGYGIPCFKTAYQIGLGHDTDLDALRFVVPNPVVENQIALALSPMEWGKDFEVSFYDQAGLKLHQTSIKKATALNPLTLDGKLSQSGIYYLQVQTGSFLKVIKFVKI